jgi:hypothetical protein
MGHRELSPPLIDVDFPILSPTERVDLTDKGYVGAPEKPNIVDEEDFEEKHPAPVLMPVRIGGRRGIAAREEILEVEPEQPPIELTFWDIVAKFNWRQLDEGLVEKAPIINYLKSLPREQLTKFLREFEEHVQLLLNAFAGANCPELDAYPPYDKKVFAGHIVALGPLHYAMCLEDPKIKYGCLRVSKILILLFRGFNRPHHLPNFLFFWFL